MPTRPTAQDFDQELLIIFDAYVHGSLDRRAFLASAGQLGAGMLGMGTAPMLMAQQAQAFTLGWVRPSTDPRSRAASRLPVIQTAMGRTSRLTFSSTARPK